MAKRNKKSTTSKEGSYFILNPKKGQVQATEIGGFAWGGEVSIETPTGQIFNAPTQGELAELYRRGGGKNLVGYKEGESETEELPGLEPDDFVFPDDLDKVTGES